MTTIQESIDVDVPLSTAYNQWTQFEEFPRFMEGVEDVKQLDDKNLHWRASVGGKTEEWDAVITEQIPDKRIAWKSTEGVPTSGVVNRCRWRSSSAACPARSSARKRPTSAS